MNHKILFPIPRKQGPTKCKWEWWEWTEWEKYDGEGERQVKTGICIISQISGLDLDWTLASKRVVTSYNNELCCDCECEFGKKLYEYKL
jgi:hypothetical protein